MRTFIRNLIIALLLIGNAGCATGKNYVVLKGQRFEVEIAATPEKQALGLMFRQNMADDHGMLFIFPGEAMRSFWMKNTRIPLDIMYFSADLKLVSMSRNTPPCRTETCPAYPSKGPARYVLELNAGKAEELGLVEGDVMVLELD